MKGYFRTKKITCTTILLVILILWCNTIFALKEWQKGVITETTETTIKVNGTTYEIDSDTVITDEHGNTLSYEVLGQKTCCDNIRFLLKNNRYIEKIIVDTSKAVR